MSDMNPYEPPAAPVDGPVSRDVSVPYTPTAGLARAVVIALCFALLADVSGVGAALLRFGLLAKIATGQHTQAEIQSNDAFYSACALFQVLTMVAAGIVFCVWFHRSYRNLRAFGNLTTYTPGWAPGSFFVPIVNLVRPFQIAKEIWTKSAPIESGSGPVGLWWALFISSSILSNIGARLAISASDSESLRTATGVGLLSDALSIGAGLLAIQMVRGIEKRQSARAAEFTAAVGT